MKSKNSSKKVTITDVFTFPSLRTKTIALCVLAFAGNFFDCFPLFYIDRLKMNIFISMIGVSTVEFVTAPISVLIIESTSRKKFINSVFLTIGLAMIILFSIEEERRLNGYIEDEGGLQFTDYLELGLLILAKYAIAFFYAMIYLYVS